jgi:hypothetical protein
VCQHYKCFFFDTPCDEPGILSALSNFTLRFNDSLGYTLPPELYLRSGFYEAGESVRFPTCDLQIYGNFADEEEYVLGDIFSDVYYLLYDYERRVVGINGYVIEGLDIIQEKSEYKLFPTWLIVLLVILAASLITCFGYFYYQKRKNQ